jgi:hypothetical protein
MAKKNRIRTDQMIDCACVIHGKGYDWIYVERLYNMLNRRLSDGCRMHVYTEHDRSVPPHMIKHCLEDWAGISGPKKSWWYKMQLFNPEHHQGNLLYFDLDVVINGDITWITHLDTEKFWTIKDFRYLQHPTLSGINSSIMWWNVNRYQHVWEKFKSEDVNKTVKQYHGDQDYLNAVIDYNNRRYFDVNRIKSYRWQIADGGFAFPMRVPRSPGAGAVIDSDTCVMVFHGHPKPHEVRDPKIVQLWV